MVARLADSAPASIGGVAVQTSSTLDGVKYRLADDSWLLIRPSGTEPVLRVYAEAPTSDGVKALLRLWRGGRRQRLSRPQLAQGRLSPSATRLAIALRRQ